MTRAQLGLELAFLYELCLPEVKFLRLLLLGRVRARAGSEILEVCGEPKN
jgi:hypothetical protein